MEPLGLWLSCSDDRSHSFDERKLLNAKMKKLPTNSPAVRVNGSWARSFLKQAPTGSCLMSAERTVRRQQAMQVDWHRVRAVILQRSGWRTCNRPDEAQDPAEFQTRNATASLSGSAPSSGSPRRLRGFHFSCNSVLPGPWRNPCPAGSPNAARIAAAHAPGVAGGVAVQLQRVLELLRWTVDVEKGIASGQWFADSVIRLDELTSERGGATATTWLPICQKT